MKFLSRFIILLFILSFHQVCHAQDTTTVDKIADFPSKLFARINNKTAGIENSLTRQTDKYLKKLARQERKLKKRLFKLDSSAAKELFSADPAQYYKLFSTKIKKDTIFNVPISGEYRAYMDSLRTSLNFLKINPGLISSSKLLPGDIDKTLNRYKQLEGKLQTSGRITEFIQQRKEQIRNYLSHYTHLPPSLAKTYHEYIKQAYYYSEQVKEYKNALNDPDRLFRVALALLNKVPLFKDFMNRNSMLAGLFGSPGNYNTTGAIQGLQSRAQVTSFIQNQLGQTSPNTASLLQKNIQSAQGQINQLRDKVNAKGGDGADLDMPDFKVNGQKTKSFLKRLEYGTNLQSTRNTYFFPITTDIGLSVGYKINDKNIIGIGTSYKIGWGKDIKHIEVSSQGIGFRSFTDINIKKNFFASGGFEYNYQQPFYSLDVVQHLDRWQQSGLIGISKIVSLKTKVFKKTKIQLLWDFLSYQQVPRTQPIKFRVGYNF